MAIPTKMIVPRWMSTVYDGTNGAELVAYFDAELISDDGQTLQFQMAGQYQPTVAPAGHYLLISIGYQGEKQCQGVFAPGMYQDLYYELPEAGA